MSRTRAASPISAGPEEIEKYSEKGEFKLKCCKGHTHISVTEKDAMWPTASLTPLK